MILYVRTDSPVAIIGLVDGKETLVERHLDLGRSTARELPSAIEVMLTDRGLGWTDIHGLVVFRGPGSFTGLRIGCTIVNTMAYALALPVVGSEGDAWIAEGVARLTAGKDDKVVIPSYGADARITTPRK